MKKKFPWLELPFTIDLDKFLPYFTKEEDSEYEIEKDNLKYQIVKEAFSSLTDIQLVVFLMRYAFGLRQKDIAATLCSHRFKRLNLMSNKTKCKSLLKQEDLISQKYKNKFNKEFNIQLRIVNSDREKQNRKAIRVLKIDKFKLQNITNRDLARRLALHNLKVNYNRRVQNLLGKFKSNKSLDKALSKNLPKNVAQPYISAILKASIKKIKEKLEKGNKVE